MKEFKVKAIVKKDFNDKTKIINNEPYHYEKDEIIEDMKRERFEELKAMGFVEEYYEIKEIDE